MVLARLHERFSEENDGRRTARARVGCVYLWVGEECGDGPRTSKQGQKR
jgi:hypothetical protein